MRNWGIRTVASFVIRLCLNIYDRAIACVHGRYTLSEVVSLGLDFLGYRFLQPFPGAFEGFT